MAQRRYILSTKGKKSIMICKKCGCRVSDTAAFCDKCGASMAEFGQKEVSVTQKGKLPEERKKKLIIVALIALGVLAVLVGVKKVATANKAVMAIRIEYAVTSSVEEIYVEHIRFGLDNVYVSFANGKDYICHVYSANMVDILTRSNYPYGTGTEKIELYESMARGLKEDGVPIAPIFVMGA